MEHRTLAQIAEILSDDNRWYCSQRKGREVTAGERDLLARHFVESGGAADFARRYREAMGKDNRWFCSQVHRRNVWEPEILWAHYMNAIRQRSVA